MPNIVSRQAILAKIESQYGVNANPTPALNAKLVESNITFSTDSEKLERDYTKGGYMGTVAGLNVVYGSNVGFTTEIKGEGSDLGVAPEIGTFFRMANYTETLTANTSAVYTPSSLFGSEEGQESATVHFHKDKWIHYIYGVRANLTISATVGQFAKMEVTGMGLYEDPAPGVVPSQTVKLHKPPRFVNAQCNIDGFEAKMKSVTFNTNNTIVKRTAACAVNGVLEYAITMRAPTLETVIELPEYCDFDPWQAMRDSRDIPISFRIGQTSLNRMSISAPYAVITSVDANSDEDGIMTCSLSFDLNRYVGNDEVSFTFN